MEGAAVDGQQLNAEHVAAKAIKARRQFDFGIHL